MRSTKPLRSVIFSLYFAAAFFAAIAVFFAGINRVPVPTVDGSIRAAEARTIVETGKWFPIVSEGKQVSDHPPLYVWLMAASFKTFGVSDFSFNLVERLFASLAVLATFLLVVESGFEEGTALLAVLILLLTRDFVLSSVRGYIEPMLETFALFSLFFSLRAVRLGSALNAGLAGLSIMACAFAKGPPALWPLLLNFGVLSLNRPRLSQKFAAKFKNVLGYLLGMAVPIAVFAIWTQKAGTWNVWNEYLNEQVLASALRGRQAQVFEPFYFANILWQYYWPWLPFLLFSGILLFGRGKNTLERRWYGALFLLAGFGFFGGFSLMRWKYWYYIAPAYPYFSAAIAISLERLAFVRTETSNRRFASGVRGVAVLWLILVAIFPIPLHLERAPEVMSFREAVFNGPGKEPVWFLHSLRDHNIIGTSGEWYFGRQVIKVEDADEKDWYEHRLKAPAFLFMWEKHWDFCSTDADHAISREVCSRSVLIQRSQESALVLYTGQKQDQKSESTK